MEVVRPCQTSFSRHVTKIDENQIQIVREKVIDFPFSFTKKSGDQCYILWPKPIRRRQSSRVYSKFYAKTALYLELAAVYKTSNWQFFFQKTRFSETFRWENLPRNVDINSNSYYLIDRVSDITYAIFKEVEYLVAHVKNFELIIFVGTPK